VVPIEKKKVIGWNPHYRRALRFTAESGPADDAIATVARVALTVDICRKLIFKPGMPAGI
jgi:hypothetical protein